MKNLVTIVAIGVLAYCVYKYQADKTKAAQKAAAEAVAATTMPKTAKTAPQQAVAISKMLEAWNARLFSEMGKDKDKQEDLVPPLQIAKERIASSKPAAGPGKAAIYDLAVNLLTSMVTAAEERTKAIQAGLEAKASDKNSLDSKGTAIGSNSFFAQATSRRWDEERKRLKPIIDQQFSQLRAAEKAWNAQTGEGVPADGYDLAKLEPLIIPKGAAAVPKGTLEKGPNDKRAIIYPWRRAYYDQYGGKPVTTAQY